VADGHCANTPPRRGAAIFDDVTAHGASDIEKLIIARLHDSSDFHATTHDVSILEAGGPSTQRQVITIEY
jgi:hypothetical protein